MWTQKQMKAWELLCDKSPCSQNNSFNARKILVDGGVPLSSAGKLLKLFEQASPHHIEKIALGEWQWRFGDDD